MTEIQAATLPKEFYEDNIIGNMALSLLDGEDAAGLFWLLKEIVAVALSAKNIKFKGADGVEEEIDMTPDPDMPVMFLKPYPPQTIEIVRHLKEKGFLQLNFANSKGCGYNIVVPSEKDSRGVWAETAIEEMCGAALARRQREQSRKAAFSAAVTERWNKDRNPEAALFTREETIRLCDELGMGSSFSYKFADGNIVTMGFSYDGKLMIDDPSLERSCICGLQTIWMAEAWRRKQNFTGTITMQDINALAEYFGQKEFSTMPIDEFIEKTKSKLTSFWQEKERQTVPTAA